ncbi:helix-turn-helix transcriptional regulator [Herbaspirillum sp. alder98]|uniref:helix-turn-helix transcriptional regulator n=1 Tax=Herbaspirillum sp. alder98 TaxID=2913096 RepID=UPI001CD845CB|nr:helix-turn-helix transcriptional regulator [Herbaspirillum sp. alder98]MCA1323916.1 helix-turn-helix transcriptional regulator [Herbaspirillum sp. alder98]
MAVAPSSHSFTLAELNRLDRPVGMLYRLGDSDPETPVVDEFHLAKGRIDRHELRPGLWLAASDLVVDFPYQSVWRQPTYFSVIALLQGKLHLHQDSALDLCAQGGVSATGGAARPLVASHAAGQQIRSLCLTVLETTDMGEDQSSELLAKALRNPGQCLQPWSLQPHLAVAFEHLFNCMWSGTLNQLLREGIGLQLLSHGLHCAIDAPSQKQPPLSPRDRQMLERVRQKLHACPGDDHSLHELARLACMSPSTLRAKFQAAYQCSVFHWLRQRRLEVAREQLAQGWSVQQAAHYVGYRHATNFSTAFRERYGICPSRLASL